MKRKNVKKIFSRFPFVALTIILLFLAFVAAILGLIIVSDLAVAHYFPGAEPYVQFLLTALAYLIVFITVMHAANRDMVPETKIPWILCIVALNLLGVAIYITFSSHRPSLRARKFYRELGASSAPYEKRTMPREALHLKMGRWASVSEALSTATPSAVQYGGTSTRYFPSGEAMWPHLLEDLKRAEKYIFLEYFIIEEGEFWNSVLEILEEKVKEGVEVRMMYDDIGCMGKVRFDYYKKLREKGIDCVKFNPFVPVIANVHNNRDHRKIVVIDGKVGYTGGLNLADEYVGLVQPFGYWKDTAVRLEGEAVRSLVVGFLRHDSMQKRRVEDFSPYVPASYDVVHEEGLVQPFFDGPHPLYGRHVAEDLIINILGAAQRYVYITTPYLIIDYRMREALILAAGRGVDVRIVTPHIPDKKIAFALTRSNYMALIKGGVKIYEFTPGFIHAKMVLSDDEVAIVGTINLDYRSFLYHFENAVLMYRTSAVEEVKADMVSIFEVSVQQSEADAKRSVVWRGICELAKLFAPLF